MFSPGSRPADLDLMDPRPFELLDPDPDPCAKKALDPNFLTWIRNPVSKRKMPLRRIALQENFSRKEPKS
jgi:hypothetical protein